VKIVPPVGWRYPCQIDLTSPSPKTFPTKLQQINTLQEGNGFDEGKDYNITGTELLTTQNYASYRVVDSFTKVVDTQINVKCKIILFFLSFI
jgi:hypothetical protein